MTNRFKEWAGRSDRSVLRQQFQPQVQQLPRPQLVTADGQPIAGSQVIAPPQPQPQGVIAYAPAPAPATVQFAQGGVGNHQPVPMPIDAIPPACVIVKPDAEYGDVYERFMATVPDIAKAQGLDLSDGVDAMELAGLPSGVSVEKWTPNSRYYNGVTDSTAPGRIDQAFARHKTGAAQVRSSNGMSNQGLLTSSRVYMGNSAGALQPVTWEPPRS